MTDPSPTAIRDAARARLERLEQFLKDDPGNLTLLADAFETALRGQEWARAEFHLRHGVASSGAAPAWLLKEGDLCLAQGRYSEAIAVLERLQRLDSPPAGFLSVVAHNLAFIDSARNAWPACVDRLTPWFEPFGEKTFQASAAAGVAALAAMQSLWLRSLHHTGQLDRAMAWALAAETVQALQPPAAGIASLVAFDSGDLAAAERWSAFALSKVTAEGRPVEALTTQGSLALAAGNYALARARIDQALSLSPNDGRAWSMRAFADLGDGDLAAAESHFERAVARMPTHIGTWHGKGWTHILQRRLDDAQAAFEQALALDRNFAESHGGLAVALALGGAPGSASKHIELAQRLDGTNLSGRYAQALLDGSASDVEAFSKLVRRLLADRVTLQGQSLAESVIKARVRPGVFD